MEIVQNASELVRYLTVATEVTPERHVLVDHYMEGKECEVDAICDGEQVLIPGIMEHIERAGVHSGDSMAIYPGLNLTEQEVDTLVDYATRIGLAMGVRGLMNIQFVIQGGGAYRSPHAPGGRLGNQRLHHRGKPPGQPHYSFHFQGYQRPRGQHRHPGHAGRDPGRHGLLRRPVASAETGGHQGPRSSPCPSWSGWTPTWGRK